jgi:mono/diheme cytochrome c family protein
VRLQRGSRDVARLVWTALGLMLFASVVVAGCSKSEGDAASSSNSQSKSSKPPPFDRAKADLVLAKFECARCHEGDRLQRVPTERHCVRCHEDILEGSFDASPDLLSEWQARIVDLRMTPTLTSIGQRFRRDWLVAFLREPVDLRPHMRATMPRMAMSREEAELIASALTSDVWDVGDIGDVADAADVGDAVHGKRDVQGDSKRGRTLFAVKGCSSCHVFTGVEGSERVPTPEREPAAAGQVLAPDLRFTRSRFRPEVLVSWLLDPASIKPDTLMPTLGLSHTDASDLAAYILETPLSEAWAPTAFHRLPLLERPVTFAEVERRVFKRVCWHCHSDPDFTGGDGGPGNTGGFGFPPRGVNLADYTSVASGALDASSRRRSLFRKSESGVPLLLDALLARHDEERGRPRARLRGMPLGLPALNATEVQLVETWVAQGRRE